MLRETRRTPTRTAAKAHRSWKTRPEPHLLRPVEPVRNLHGKEGVDGSSPSEGFTKSPANGPFCCLPRRSAGDSRVRDGYIFGRAGTRGHPRYISDHVEACRSSSQRQKVPANTRSTSPVLSRGDHLLGKRPGVETPLWAFDRACCPRSKRTPANTRAPQVLGGASRDAPRGATSAGSALRDARRFAR